MRPSASRVAVVFAWVLAGGPSAFLISVLSHALHLRLHLRRWPVVYRDDPYGTWLSIHDIALGTTLYWSLIGLPVWLALALFLGALRLARPTVLVLQLALILSGIMGIVLLILYDPTGYVEWFLD